MKHIQTRRRRPKDHQATRTLQQLHRDIFSRCSLVLCPAHAHLPARSGLVNEVKFLGFISPKVVKINEITKSVLITCTYNSKICSSPFKYPFFFWAGCLENVLNVARLHCCKSVLYPRERVESKAGLLFPLELDFKCDKILYHYSKTTISFTKFLK